MAEKRKKKKKRKKRLPLNAPLPRLVSGCCLRSTRARPRLLRTALVLQWIHVPASVPEAFLGRIPHNSCGMGPCFVVLVPLASLVLPRCTFPRTTSAVLRLRRGTLGTCVHSVWFGLRAIPSTSLQRRWFLRCPDSVWARIVLVVFTSLRRGGLPEKLLGFHVAHCS